jgi:hypothetical protein
MKLEAQFENKEGKLFSIKTGSEIATDSLVKTDISSVGAAVLSSMAFAEKIESGRPELLGVCVAWEKIEISEAVYDEEFLAAFRNFLKNLEAFAVYAVIVPETAKAVDGSAAERYTAAMVHTARRIKDCGSVIGFALPEALSDDAAAGAAFIDAMKAKHAQYVYFSEKDTGSKQLIPYHMR